MPRIPLRRAALAAGAVAAVCAAVPATAPAKPQDLKVMVRNVYLGADLIPLALAANKEEFERNAGQRFQTVLRNDFATRAKALAREIRAAKPDVIGVQEAAIWRRGAKDGSTTKATQEVYDSTELLLKELASLGQKYRLAVARDWFDFEAPTTEFDARLTQRDVILVRRNSKVKFGKVVRGGFEKTLTVPTQAGNATQARGYVGIDGTLAKKRFRFVTTHLEAYDPATAETQMNELLAGPVASKKRQMILVGDFNSDPKDAGTDDRGAERAPNAYAAALDAGFFNPLKRRETCCFAEDLSATTEVLDSWIDHVVARPRLTAVKSGIVGTKQVGGLYPADHAGITATLRLKKR